MHPYGPWDGNTTLSTANTTNGTSSALSSTAMPKVTGNIELSDQADVGTGFCLHAEAQQDGTQPSLARCESATTWTMEYNTQVFDGTRCLKAVSLSTQASVSPLQEMIGRWISSCASGIVLHWAMPTSGITRDCPTMGVYKWAKCHLSEALTRTQKRAVLMWLVVNLWLEQNCTCGLAIRSEAAQIRNSCGGTKR